VTLIRAHDVVRGEPPLPDPVLARFAVEKRDLRLDIGVMADRLWADLSADGEPWNCPACAQVARVPETERRTLELPAVTNAKCNRRCHVDRDMLTHTLELLDQELAGVEDVLKHGREKYLAQQRDAKRRLRGLLKAREAVAALSGATPRPVVVKAKVAARGGPGRRPVQCSRCETTDEGAFYPSQISQGGRQVCRGCMKERARERKQAS